MCPETKASMPTLGFLKKKKPKEHDPNAPSSPVEQSTGGHKASLASTSGNTLSSAGSSDKAGETVLPSHGLPTPTSAPRSGGEDQLVAAPPRDESSGSTLLMVNSNRSRTAQRTQIWKGTPMAQPPTFLRASPPQTIPPPYRERPKANTCSQTSRSRGR